MLDVRTLRLGEWDLGSSHGKSDKNREKHFTINLRAKLDF